jgi:hypothetical protein
LAEDRTITVSAWPAEPARLSHTFEGEPPLPVRVGFAQGQPLAVRLGSAGSSIPIDMRMLLAAPRAIPLCLSLCEALCAESDYTIGITLFDRPIISIRLRGRTRIHSES